MKINVFIICLFFSFYSCSQNSFVNYKSPNGYSFSYSDKEWQLERSETHTILFNKLERSSNFNTNINILVQDLSNTPMSLSDYHKITLYQMVQALGKNTVESDRDIKVSGTPAKEIIYIIPQDISKGNYIELKLKQIYLIKNDKAYLITYTSVTKDFDTYLKSANKVFETFKIL